jgi:hypothetical protein
MKNLMTIINSDLTKEEKHLADLLNEQWIMCKVYEKRIKLLWLY